MKHAYYTLLHGHAQPRGKRVQTHDEMHVHTSTLIKALVLCVFGLECTRDCSQIISTHTHTYIYTHLHTYTDTQTHRHILTWGDRTTLELMELRNRSDEVRLSGGDVLRVAYHTSSLCVYNISIAIVCMKTYICSCE